MRYVIQIKINKDVVLDDFSKKVLLNNGVTVSSKKKVVTGLAEDFDEVFKKAGTFPFLRELRSQFENGDYAYM